MKAVIVTGDRHATPERWRETVYETLFLYERPNVVIHGAAPGIDSIAGDVARTYYMAEVPVPALWKKDGPAAGPIRNSAMLSILTELKSQGYEVAVIAFHDDLWNSKGTRNMVTKAKTKGVPVLLYTSAGEASHV